MIRKEDISNWFKSLQAAICTSLEEADQTGKFIEDNWIRNEGGGGCTRILQEGTVIEKGGVLFSAVHGPVPAFLSGENVAIKKEDTFYATGVSIVIHPHNPMVPIIHMNVRYFEMSNGIWWFGGGIDLTPHYVNEADAKFFHAALKATCDKHDPSYYTAFKNWADDYFFIPHRNETRGIGGIFFDKLSGKEERDKERIFDFVKEVGNAFAPTYTALMRKNYQQVFTTEQKKWQLLRRGRYVEFNLVYDKGTRFGLETNGRTESILMSLPSNASWMYNYLPSLDSAEAKTLSLLRKGIIWHE
jgi:coproporphyrinogen III oxidase